MSHLARAAFVTRAVGGTVLGLVLVSLCTGQPAALEDPLPLKRVQIPAGRVPLELERARQGILVQMPRKEFETKVREAAEAAEAAKKVPRLLRASYAAEFDGHTALQGRRGHWTVVNPAASLALLPVGDLNLALANLQNNDLKPGILGELDGKTVSLLLEKSGTQEFFFEWSLRGTPGPAGVRFELRVPPSPVAALELKTPAEFEVQTPRGGALVTAVPDGGKKAAHRQWLLHFSGSSRVEFVLRKSGGATDLPPLILTESDTTQELRLQGVLADFDFHIEVLHQAVTRLVFDCDAELQPFRVVPVSPDGKARPLDVEKWDFSEGKPADDKDAKAASAPGKLTVHLREPFQGGPTTLRVSCLAPLADGGLWKSPAVRLRQGSSRGERLKLVLVPDVLLEQFEAGSFHLQSGGFDSEGKQTLILSDRSALLLQRPRGIVRTRSVQLSAGQRTWWQVGGEKSALTTHITYQLAHGRLFQLALRLPKGATGWQVESVEMEPKDLLRQWVPAGPLVLIDLERALTPQTQAKLKVRLQANQPISSAGATLDLPDIEPAVRCTREGLLAISADPRFQATVLQPSAAASPPEAEGPWSPELPAHFYAFRGQGVTGKLRLTPHPPRLQARSQAEVFVAPRGGSARVRFDVEAVVGTPDSVVLFIPEIPGERWKWTADNNSIRAVERLADLEWIPLLLGGPGGLMGQAVFPRGEYWRLAFGWPFTARQTIIAETPVDPLPPRGQLEHTWHIPIPLVVQADRHDGEIHVQARGASLEKVSSDALESEQPAGQNKKSAARGESDRRFRFRWEAGKAYPRLRLATQTVGDTPAIEICDRAHWTTYVEPGKPVLNHVRFVVGNWQRHDLPVLLPRGARVLAAQIDGRWIQPLPQQELAAGLQVILPAPSGDELHQYELVYQSEAPLPGFAPWFVADVPPPQLPIAPVRWRHTWRLAPGLAPLNDSVLQRVTPRERESLREALRDAWTAGDHLLEGIVARGADDGAGAQRQFLLASEAALRRTTNVDAPLGELLNRLAVDYLKNQVPLVLDMTALRHAGLGRRTRMSASLAAKGRIPFWEDFGLVHVPCRTGALLTTRQALDRYSRSGRSLSGFAAAHEADVMEAGRAGRDASGRFGTVDQWLQTSADNGFSGTRLEQLLPDALEPDWTEWETLPQSDPAERLLLVSSLGVRLGAISVALACLGLAVGVGSRLAPVWRVRLLLVWLVGALLGLIWLPAALRELASWLAAAAILVLILSRFSGRRARAAPAESPATEKFTKAVSSATAIVFLLVVVGLMPVRAQAPEAHMVLLLPEPAAGAGEAIVLVTPDLLKQLDDVRTRGVPSLRHAALISADYKGTLSDDGAEFTAVFHFYAFADGVQLVLPLGAVDLKERVFLNGRPVFPVALPAPQQGYGLPVPSKGLHRLELSFGVRLPAGGEELRFAIPKVSQSYLELTLPGELHNVRVANAQGQEQVEADGKTQILRAHLGREGSVAVQWRRDSRPALPADVQLAEAYFWDLRVPGATLTGVLNYTITKGSVSQLSVLLPDGIELRSVDVNEPGLLGGSRLKTWSLQKKAADRVVHLELVRPLSGRLQVRLGLVPRLGKAPDAFLLKLPVPQGVKSTQGVLGYRLEGADSEDKPLNVGVTSIGPEAFQKVWQASEPGKVLPTRAYSFRRTTSAAALLLSLSPPRPQAVCRVLWQVQPHHADFTATVQWTAAGDRPLLLLEVDVPGAVTLTAIEGAAVRQWTRSEASVQIWLDRPSPEATLQLRGYLKHAQKLYPAKVGRFVLPVLRFPRSVESPGPVQVMPGPGLGLEVEHVKGLVRSPVQEPGGVWTFAPAAPVYEGVFRLKAAPQSADARVLTQLESRNGFVQFVSRLEYWIPHGELRSLTMHVRNWPGDEVRLEASVPIERSQHRKTADGHAWTVTLPPGVTRRLAIKISGQLPEGKSSLFAVPEVTMVGGKLTEQYVALVGPGWQPAEQAGLERVQNLAQALRAWPAEREILGREAVVWRAKDAIWKLSARSKAAATAPAAHLLLAEHEAAPARSGHWIHQIGFLVHATPGTNLVIRMPTGARPLAVAVNGRLTPPQHVGEDRLLVPLTGAAPMHVVQIQWNERPEDEPFASPRRASPFLENADRVPTLMKIHLPPKTDLATPEDPDVVLGRIALCLQRAEAYVRLSKLLTEPSRQDPESPQDLLSAQKHFEEHYRWGICQMGLATKMGYDVQPLRKRVEGLREENRQLAKERGFESIRQDAERQPASESLAPAHAFFILADTGRPVFAPSDTAVPVVLTSLTQKQFQEATVFSHLVLVLLLLLLVASYFAWLRFVFGLLWPEQVGLVALLGWLSLGPSVVGGILLLTGIVARLAIVIGWLRARAARPATAPPASSVTPAA